MPSTAPSLGAASALLLVAGVGAAGTGVVDLPSELEDSLETAVGEALNKMNARWLEITDGQGYAEDDEVVRLRLLADPASIQGSMEVDPLVVIDSRGNRTQVTGFEAVRDDDGSLEEGVMTSEDLVRLKVNLTTPIPSDESRRITFHHPEGPAIQWGFSTPRNLDSGWNSLDSR